MRSFSMNSRCGAMLAMRAGLVACAVLAAGAPALAEDAPKTGDKVVDTTKEAKKAADEAAKKAKEAAKLAEKDARKKADDAKSKAKAGGVTAGDVAPAFTLKDTDGKDHTLADMTKAGKIVVIQWFNADCPFVKKHYRESKTFNDLATKYKDKNVEFVAINSNSPGTQGAGLDRNKKAKTDWAIPYPILLDESGDIGKAYGAKRTPEMFIINKDGKVVYHGAIDDDAGGDSVGSTNYVSKALDEVLDGKDVTMATSKPYGCSVKYKD